MERNLDLDALLADGAIRDVRRRIATRFVPPRYSSSSVTGIVISGLSSALAETRAEAARAAAAAHRLAKDLREDVLGRHAAHSAAKRKPSGEAAAHASGKATHATAYAAGHEPSTAALPMRS